VGRERHSSSIRARHLVQVETAARRKAALLIGVDRPRHSAFGLQPKTLQGIPFQCGEVDLEANWYPDWRVRLADYKHSQDADITCAADALLVLS
jgi:hypothetical protein